MKRRKILTMMVLITIILLVVYFSLPYYARQALIHRMPVIDDLSVFHYHVVGHQRGNVWHWPLSTSYNKYQLCKQDAHYIDSLHTTAFLVIKDDSILFESYRDGWNEKETSNIYSATKTIVGLLAGIAWDEGKIKTLDDPVSSYLPMYVKGKQADVTIRDLLTMSGGMAWDESYSSLFSVTTHGYYGNDLFDLVTNLEVKDEPGIQYSYRSGETQLLAFVIEAAVGMSLSEYTEEKLWKPIQTEQDAYWLLDKENGDEKAFCCFHTIARDVARFARLMLHHGEWNGRQLVSEEFMDAMLKPASYLKDQWGKDSLNYYGYLTWILHYKNQINPFMRGMLGQYIIAVPNENAIIVRLGRKRYDVYDGALTTDIIRYMDIAMDIIRHSKE